MTTPIYAPPTVKNVVSRPVKAQAIQFRYGENREATLCHVRKIEAFLAVQISCASDQGGLFIHLQLDRYQSLILSDGDWVMVDSFAKISVVKDETFKIYYEPQE